MKSGRVKRILLSVIAFLFVGCSIAGGTVLLSNSSISDSNRGGGDSTPSENELTKNAPTNSDLWTASGNYATSFAGGDGQSEATAYQISTPEQLARLAYLVNNGSEQYMFSNTYFVQTADIDLSLHYWDAIGAPDYYFSGHYDGGNFTISGLYTRAGSSSTYSYQGLFGYVEGRSSSIRASIKNIGIIDSNIQGYQYVGGVAGYASSSTFTNCYNTGTVSGSDGRVGGVVGGAYDYSTVSNCYNTGAVTGDGSIVGGVVGYAYDYSIITNCYNTGAVDGRAYVGGVVGYAYDDSTITNSYNTGSVIGSSSYVGGVAGYVSSSTVTNCYNTGSVSGGGDDVGGVVGNVYDSTVINCYYGGNCTLLYGIGSSSSNTGASKDENLIANAKSLSWYQNSSKWSSFYSWNFDWVWRIDANKNNGYPYLNDDPYGGSHKPNNPSQFWTDEGNYAISFAGGDGSEEDPYKIATPAQLARLAYLVIYGSEQYMFSNTYFVQTTDLDMSEFWWNAIGTYTSPTNIQAFAGTYDGGEHTISGLYTQSSRSYQGLFGYVGGQSNTNKATIKNVGITDSNIQGYYYVGGVAGFADSYVAVTNCYNTGDITGSDYVGGVVGEAHSDVANCYNTGDITGSDYVGGVVGFVTHFDITNCYNTGTVTGGAEQVGGVVGYAIYSVVTNCYNTGAVTGVGNVGGVAGLASSYTITNCYNTGSVYGREGCVGGVAGYSSARVINCYNTGSVSGSNQYVGGVVGYAYYSQITNSYNSGPVTGNYYVGGVVGYARSFTITNCYNTGTVTGSNYVGGVVGYAYGSTVTNCYNTGSVTGDQYVGGVAGSAYSSNALVTYNCYYGGNCTLSYGIGDSSSNAGASKDENLIANAKSLSWYQDSSKWASEYPWDFVEVWSLVPSANDGYPILQGFSVNISYNSNFGENETVTEQVPSGQEIVIAGYDLFTRVGYEIAHWNTKSDGTGLNFYAGNTYSEGAGLTLYAIWEAGIYAVTLDANGGSGGTQEIWVKYGYGFYANSSATGNPITSLTSLPTREGYTFNGFYTSATSGTRLIDSTGKIVASNTFTTKDVILYAQWTANNPAYYDEEGGYWYVENGKLPQSKVSESLKSTLSSSWGSLSNGDVYYMGVEELAENDLAGDGGMQSKVYNGEEYVKFNGEYYLVEPVRWRLVYSDEQDEGYAVEKTSVLATMAEIVFVGSYSSTKIGVGAGYSAESVTMLLKNQVSDKYLVSESREVEIFGAPKDTTTVSGSVFVASMEELANFTTSKNNTTGSGVKAGKASFSDFVKDYLRATGQGNYYFTRDLGDQLNTILCLNPVGDRSQSKAQQTLGVQFTVKVTEYACVSA